jgi:hypothetical protein
MAYIAGSYQVNSNLLHHPSIPQLSRRQVCASAPGHASGQPHTPQLHAFMNILEDGKTVAGCAAPGPPPTPPVHPAQDHSFAKDGSEEHACLRDWVDGGYVALANFNQVGDC